MRRRPAPDQPALFDLPPAPLPYDPDRVHERYCGLDPHHHRDDPCVAPGYRGRGNSVADAIADFADARQRWQRLHFRRALWTAPHDTAGGMKAGDTKLGWRCPVCSDVEPNEFWLHLNHGWDPGIPNGRPWHGYCWRATPVRVWQGWYEDDPYWSINEDLGWIPDPIEPEVAGA